MDLSSQALARLCLRTPIRGGRWWMRTCRGGLTFLAEWRYDHVEMATRFAYTILFVHDMHRSIVFYRDLVGLTLKMESPEWSEFATGGCTLALHQAAAGVDPLPVPEADRLPAGHAHTGFAVDDLDAFAAQMSAAGVVCFRPVSRQDFGGRMGVWSDPDGIPVSVMSSQ